MIMEVKTVGLASDHAGFPMKQFVLQYLEKKGYPVKDYGTYSDESVDYPDFAHALAEGIENGDVYPGIGICGTGVLFPYYLNRNVARVIGVDISPEMAKIAASKLHDPRIEVLCGDMETIPVRMQCDCCVIYNAFPHFEEPERLINRLARWVKPGGRLTVAHSMGLGALRRHHAGRAEHVSREMLKPEKLAEFFAPWFRVDSMVSDEARYLVSGERTDMR